MISGSCRLFFICRGCFGIVLGCGLLLGTHLREEEHVLDGRRSGHEHGEAVDAHAEAGCRGHAVLEGADEVHVDVHRLVVALVLELELLLEAVELVDGVVELAVGVGQFLAVHEELEALGEGGIAAVTLGQGRGLPGVVGDEGGGSR